MDLCCDDYDRAARNREMVAKKLYVSAYLQVESALAGLPVHDVLPYWMPKDTLVYVDMTELLELVKKAHLVEEFD